MNKSFSQHFYPKEVALCTIAYYPKWYEGKLRDIKDTDKVRGDLALETIQKAIDGGYQVVVVYRSSSLEFFKHLQSLHCIIETNESKKRSPKRRQAFVIASRLPEMKAIVWTEAEKTSFIDSIPQVTQPIRDNKADIVVSKREETHFKKSYPHFQYKSETEGNQEYNRMLRKTDLLLDSDEDLDAFFGPRAFRNTSDILSLFTKQYDFPIDYSSIHGEYFDLEEYSNSLCFPIVEALYKKLRVASVTISFVYPLTQKKNEEIGEKSFIAKRVAQKESILLEHKSFLAYLQKEHR